MELKDRIRELRIKRNLTLSQLAAAMGKSEGAIRSWETGRAKPDADSLVKLSDFFCCTVDYLLGRSDTITSSTKASEVFIYYLQTQMDVLRVEIEEGTESASKFNVCLCRTRRLCKCKTQGMATFKDRIQQTKE